MMNRILLGLVAGALAMPALATEPAPADQHYSKPKKPHMICKREESTGSHMSKPVCKTAAEWAENAAADEATLGTVSRQSTTLDTGGTLSRERPN
jgi:hypothetical protein